MCLTHLLAAFGGHLLTALSVTGIAAHWINTAREIKQLSSIIYRKAVLPHYSAKAVTKDQTVITWETKTASTGMKKTSCANKGQTVWRNLGRDGATDPMSPVENNLIRAEGGERVGLCAQGRTKHSAVKGMVSECVCVWAHVCVSVKCNRCLSLILTKTLLKVT